nr:MAG: hypothetical protein [Molluscum contagiosum virus]
MRARTSTGGTDITRSRVRLFARRSWRRQQSLPRERLNS